nr:hypothetical protein [Tanacetum cinerariifolium]
MFSLMWIMPPRVMTRSTDQHAAAPQGGGTGGRVGREGRRVREPRRRKVEPTGEPEGQGNDQGVEVNEGVDGVPDFSMIIAQQLQNLLHTMLAQGDVRNVIVNNGRSGCTYKEFLACNPKEYDGKGGAIVYTCWIEKMESVQDMSGCGDDKKVKYTAGSFVLMRKEFFPSKEMQKLETELWNYAMVEAGHAAYTDRFHELARLVPHLVNPKSKKVERNGSIKKNPEKRGNRGESRKDRNVRDDNKRTSTGNAFATTTNPNRRENTGMTPKCITCNSYHPLEAPRRTCFNCNHPGNFAKDCRMVPRNVNPINARNPTVRTCYEYGSTDHFKTTCPRNQARGRAFMLGAEEAYQDPNIMTGITLRKISTMANTTPIMTTVTKNANKEKTPKEADAALKANILDFCKEHYEEILPVIMDKIRRDKRKEVHARLDFKENPRKSRRSAFDRLSNTYSPSTTKSGPNEGNSRDLSHSRGRSRRQGSSSRDRPRNKNRPYGIEESYEEGKVNSHYLACRRAAPAIKDTRKQGQKGASQQMKKTCPYRGLARIKGTEGPLVIEAVVGGHGVHRIYVDGGSSMKGNYMAAQTVKALATPKDSTKNTKGHYDNFKVAIHPEFLDQEITIGGTVSTKARMELCILLKGNLDIFAWQPSDMTRVPQSIAEHRIDNREGYSPVRVRKHDGRGNPSRGTKTGRGRNSARSILPRLVIQLDHEGMSLGYMISPERVKLCPDKTDAVLQLPSPRTIKEHRWGCTVHVSVDSKLVANQVLGTYVAKEENMIKYLEKAKSLISGITNFSIGQVPRSKNKKADALSKIALTSFAHLSKQVLVEVLKEKSIQEREMATVVEEEGPTWMKLIIKYLRDETLTDNRKEARKLHIKARQHDLLEGILYRRSFLKPWLRLPDTPPSAKISSTTVDSHHGPVAILQMGIDIAGPFSKGPGKVKFLIVAIDYFTKWIEARLWQQLLAVNGDPFKDWCEKLNIVQRFASIKHPQSNGLVERANRSLGEGIKARQGKGNKNWLEELPYVLWAYCTMIKSSNEDTLFSLTYGTEAIIPTEIGMPTYRTTVVDVVHNNEELRLNLDILKERHERAAINGGKLGPKWEGAYEVMKALGDETYKLRSTNGMVLSRT